MLLLSGCTRLLNRPSGFPTPEEAARNSLTSDTTQKLQIHRIIAWGNIRLALFSKVETDPNSGEPQSEIFGYETIHRGPNGWGGFMAFAFGREHPRYAERLLGFAENHYTGGGQLRKHFALYGFANSSEVKAVEAHLLDGAIRRMALENSVFALLFDLDVTVCKLVALDEQDNELEQYPLRTFNGSPRCEPAHSQER